MSDQQDNLRILVIDDNESIHNDFRKILADEKSSAKLDAAMAALLGEDQRASSAGVNFELHSAMQGQEGLRMVEEAVENDERYAMAFVDMRMPPGWDGLKTIERIWAADSEIEVVICTAYSDHTWDDIVGRVGESDRLLILKKPFDTVEARQLAYALTRKWNLRHRSETLMSELREALETLEIEVHQREAAEERLRHEVLHDALTGLPNRVLLNDRIGQCLLRRMRDADYHFGLLHLNLDGFRMINQTLGHEAGDELVRLVAERLTTEVRSADSKVHLESSTTSRFGGDEFIVLLDGLNRAQDAEVVAERVRDIVSRPLVVSGHELSPSVSIGVAAGRSEYRRSEEILRDGATALAHAKTRGKGEVVFFLPEMRAQVLARMFLEGELRKAIEDRALTVHYQPIVSLQSMDVVSFEALVRWTHSERGPISPAEFIPVAEATGLVRPLGNFVLHEACKQVAEWVERFPELERLSVSVNVSGEQIVSGNLVAEVEHAILEADLDPRRLKIELTESTLMDHTGDGVEVLNLLRDRGLAIHMDDFGTGYSSLSYLHRLPIDAIKIDRSFVQGMLSDEGLAATVEGVLTVARARGMKVIAEGIETPEQFARLQAMGCDYGQGFLFARPMDGEAATRLLAEDGHGFQVAG